MLRGLAAVAPPQVSDELRHAQEQLSRQRPQAVAAARGLTLASLAASSAKAGDADLDRYLAYLRSVDGRRANQALIGAIGTAMSDAAEDFGRAIPALLRTAAR